MPGAMDFYKAVHLIVPLKFSVQGPEADAQFPGGLRLSLDIMAVAVQAG